MTHQPDTDDVTAAAEAVETIETRLRTLRARIADLDDERSATGRHAIAAECDELAGSIFAYTGRARFALTRRP